MSVDSLRLIRTSKSDQLVEVYMDIYGLQEEPPALWFDQLISNVPGVTVALTHQVSGSLPRKVHLEVYI